MKRQDTVRSASQSASTSVATTSTSTRHLRRVAVIAIYLGYLLMTLLWTPAKALGWGWAVIVSSLGLLAVMGYAMLMVSQYGIMSSQNKASLDERQEAVRNRAYRLAYGILGALACFAALYLYIAADSGSLWLPTTSNELQAAFWGVLLLTSTLPAAVLAWTEPDPVAPDPEGRPALAAKD